MSVTPVGSDTAFDPAELVKRIGAGDRRAENDFVRRFSPGLLTMLRVRCADVELCRDIVQDALRVTIERLRGKGLEDPAGLGGFVRGTALNLLANALRKSEHRLTSSASDWLDDVVCESSDPYDTVESDDLVRAVREVMGGMKVARDRELLWRYYVLEDPKPKLCAEYDLSPEHFDRVLHRARGRLKELLAESLGRTG